VSWVADLLPDDMAPLLAGVIDAGLPAMEKTLESSTRTRV